MLTLKSNGFMTMKQAKQQSFIHKSDIEIEFL